MKYIKSLQIGVATVMAVVMLCVTGCKQNATSTELLDTVSDDAMVVALMKADDLLGDDLQIAGVDTKQALLATYGRTLCAVGVVTDKSKLEKSLKRLAANTGRTDGFDVYDLDDYGYALTDGEFVWFALNGSSLAKAAEEIRTALHTQKPLADWKRDKLMAGSDKQAVGIISAPGLMLFHLLCTAEINGPKADIDIKCLKADGSAVVDGDLNGLKPIPAEYAKYLSEDDMLAVAVGSDAGDVNIFAPLVVNILSSNFGMSMSSDENEFISDLTGGLFASVNLSSPTADIYDLMSYNIAIGLQTNSGEAKPSLDRLAGLLNGFPLQRTSAGYHIAIEDFMDVNMTVDGDNILLTTASQSDHAKVAESQITGCMVWATVNIPAGLPLLKLIDIDFGIKARIHATNTEAHVSAEFTDTKLGFLQAVEKICDNF